MDADKLIRERLHVKRGDSLPYCGYNSSRMDLIAIMAELGYKEGAEIGVCVGKFSEVLCQGIPGLHLTGVDPWTEYQVHSQARCDRRYAEAVARLAPHNVTIVKETSLRASLDVADGSLDFVYIDGDHRFEAVLLDILLWEPKVRVGGMVAGHDWYAFWQSGVVQAVLAYTQGRNIGAWYITKDREPSWLWVKK